VQLLVLGLLAVLRCGSLMAVQLVAQTSLGVQNCTVIWTFIVLTTELILIMFLGIPKIIKGVANINRI